MRAHHLELTHELADVLERAVHAREAHVGDGVELLQVCHHELADLRRGHFLLAQIEELALEYCGGDARSDPGKVMHAWRARPQGVRLYRATGCARCDRTGYRGRMALYELLVADATIKRLVQSRSPVNEIAAAAAAGGTRSLKQDGIEKMLLGLTDLPQVRTV